MDLEWGEIWSVGTHSIGDTGLLKDANLAYKSRRRVEGFLSKIGSDEDGANIDVRKITHVTGAFVFQPP